LLSLGQERLQALVYPLSVYSTNAKHLMAACRMLVEQYGGQLPRSRDALLQLPGVGRKTANVLANVLYGEETYGVDTHVFRVCNRTGLAPGKTPEAVEKGLMDQVPAPYRRDAHHWLVLFGRYVCKARKPNCSSCPIRDLCAYAAIGH
jgi:endonuclease-3